MKINKFKTHLAAGCSTSKSLKIVAPSLVTVTSPRSSTNILSKPTGPKELLTMLAMEHAAITVNKKKELKKSTPTLNRVQQKMTHLRNNLKQKIT